MLTDSYPICENNNDCYGKVFEKLTGYYKCKILTSTYRRDECPFCKPSMTITNNKIYPYSPRLYAMNHVR